MGFPTKNDHFGGTRKHLYRGSGDYMGVSLNGGTQQPWVFLPKMIILGCFGGTRKHPYRGSGDYMGVSLNGGTQQP